MQRKRIVLAGVALALGALVAVAVAAHEEHNPPFLGHLDLTDEQQEQLQALHTQHEEAMRAQHETMAAMREQFHEAVNEILTDEQRATLGPRLALWAHTMPRHFRGLAADQLRTHGVPEDILSGEYIDIEALKESIGDIRGSVEHWGDMWGIRNEFAQLALTDEQKKQLKKLHQEQRETFYKWRREQRKAMESILTAEQREKLEMLKDEAFYGGQYGFKW